MPDDATSEMLKNFEFSHLQPPMREVSQKFNELAHFIASATPDNVERDFALRKLLESKDCAVRATRLKARSQQG